jgi:hypothetical protein
MIPASTSNPHIQALLAKHPKVAASEGISPGLSFETSRRRSISMSSGSQVGGLIELMDNNPLVCTDEAWIPTPAGTLALIGLGPLMEAGLVVEEPAILLSFPDEEQGILDALKTVNWTKGVTFQCEDHDLGSVRGAYILAKINNPEDWDDIDALYSERYGRSFMIQEVDSDEWRTELVEDEPWACYYMELSEGEKQSILAIHVMADIHGKLGAAQYVHMMNVMCGFEESLGLI